MTYRPPFRKQLDGSRCQGTNCNCASHAMASQRARKGVDPKTASSWPPMPVPIRNRINRFCPGTSLGQNEAAVLTLYRVDMWPRYNIPWTSFVSMIVSGRGAVALIQYSVIAPTRFDACPGFTGRHAIFINERRPSDGALLVYDTLADGRRRGIPKGPQWWPASLLRRAMEAYPGTDPGHVSASYTRDTEP